MVVFILGIVFVLCLLFIICLGEVTETANKGGTQPSYTSEAGRRASVPPAKHKPSVRPPKQD